MNNLFPNNRVYTLDGGFSNTIESLGVCLHPKLWTGLCVHDHYKEVVKTHQAFVRSGADIVTTSTYQMSFEGYQSENFNKEDSIKFMRSAIKAAREGSTNSSNSSSDSDSKSKVKVAISVGPYGAILADGSEYTGAYAFEYGAMEKLKSFHYERLLALQSTDDHDDGGDLYACETIPCINECKAIIHALQESNAINQLPVYLSLSIKDNKTLNSDESLDEAVRVIEELTSGYDIGIGINCCSPSVVEEALITIRNANTSKNRVLLAYPNLGETWDASDRDWKSNSGINIKEYSNYVNRWIDAGARIIGGCCRTTPEYISAVNEIINQNRK